MNIQRLLLLPLIPFLILLFSCKEEIEEDKKPTEREMAYRFEPDLKVMIGQMIMVGTRGMKMEDISPVFLTQVDSGYVGGIILFDYDMVNKEFYRNIESPEQVKKLVAGLQSHAPTPLFMAIDQEGGKVNRLKPKYGFPYTVSAQYLGELDNLDSTRYYATRTAETLKELGFNVNFAPDVDIDLNPNNPVIGKYERSFSSDPNGVIQHASEWIKAQDAAGIISTIKHFPGHGSSDSDSHEGVTDITNYWQERELRPFEALTDMDALVAVMTAHVVNNKLDSIYPATLSKNIITGILREDLEFEGLIFSDDMQMKAVNKMFSFEEILENSIHAGVDVLVFGNNLEYDENIPERAVNTILRMIEDGKIGANRIKDSYERIMQAKRKVN